LLKAKGPDITLCKKLGEDWYFLRRAIETAFTQEPKAEEALPYRVLADYQRRIRSQDPIENLLARQEAPRVHSGAKETRKESNT
jgi:hypothetical protein